MERIHHVELYKRRMLVDRTHNLTIECDFFLLFKTNLPCIQDDDDDADAAAMPMKLKRNTIEKVKFQIKLYPL